MNFVIVADANIPLVYYSSHATKTLRLGSLIGRNARSRDQRTEDTATERHPCVRARPGKQADPETCADPHCPDPWLSVLGRSEPR